MLRAGRLLKSERTAHAVDEDSEPYNRKPFVGPMKSTTIDEPKASNRHSSTSTLQNARHIDSLQMFTFRCLREKYVSDTSYETKLSCVGTVHGILEEFVEATKSTRIDEP